MVNLLRRKRIVSILIFLFIVIIILPNITGFDPSIIKDNNTAKSSFSNDDIFDDYNDDVICMYFKSLYSGIRRTNEKPNINIVKGNHLKNSQNVTLTFEVEGVIENKGNMSIIEESFVLYAIVLNTSKNNYHIEYINKSCFIKINNLTINYTNLIVNNSTFSITFNLNEISEKINFIEIFAFDFKYTEDKFEGELCIDIATNIEYSMDIEIIKPTNSLYLFNKQFLHLSSPVIFGNINVEFKELINETKMSFRYAELYINNELIAFSNIMGVLRWNRLSFGKYNMKVIVFDDYGNRDFEEIEVWKFF
jgi:hypothetical protein